MDTQNIPAQTTLFVKTGCPFCAKAREYLAAQHIDFIERNVSEDQDALEMLKRISRQDETPTLLFERDLLNDFDVEELAAFLEKHGVHAERS